MNLEQLIKKEIEDLKNGKINERVTSFQNYGNKYAVLKPKVVTHVELAKGVVADIDISDYFVEDVK